MGSQKDGTLEKIDRLSNLFVTCLILGFLVSAFSLHGMFVTTNLTKELNMTKKKVTYYKTVGGLLLMAGFPKDARPDVTGPLRADADLINGDPLLVKLTETVIRYRRGVNEEPENQSRHRRDWDSVRLALDAVLASLEDRQ